MILVINGRPQRVSAKTDALTRAVIISLFTWRRAHPDDETESPMGWWGDSFPTVQNDRIGSRLYLLRRSKLMAKTPALAKGYIEEALRWMVEDRVIARLDVEVSRQGNEAVTANVTLYRHDGTAQSLEFDNFWSDLNGG